MLAPAKPELVRYLSENSGAVIEEAAKLHAVTPRDVVEALPAEMRRFAPADSFIAAMQDVATWGDVTLIIHTDDGIMEFGGPIPRGEVGRGYFNLMGSKGFHGHLRRARFPGAPLHGQALGADRVLQCGRRHHVQDLCRPRREA
jgi:putative heme utilization carrier protein HutX